MPIRSSDAFGRLTPEALFANSAADRSGIAVLVNGVSHLREIVGEHFETAPSVALNG
jgi:hypothetical protein